MQFEQIAVDSFAICSVQMNGEACEFKFPVAMYQLLGLNEKDIQMSSRYFTTTLSMPDFLANLIGLLKNKYPPTHQNYSTSLDILGVFFRINGGKSELMLQNFISGSPPIQPVKPFY